MYLDLDTDIFNTENIDKKINLQQDKYFLTTEYRIRYKKCIYM